MHQIIQRVSNQFISVVLVFLLGFGLLSCNSGTTSSTTVPQKGFVYITNSVSHTISMYSIDDSNYGNLVPLNPATVTTGTYSPMAITTDTWGPVAYALTGNVISEYSVNKAGVLESLASISTLTEPSAITVAHRWNGHDQQPFVYVTGQSSGGKVAMYTEDGYGVLSHLDPESVSAGDHPSGITNTSDLIFNNNTRVYVYVTNQTDSTISMYSISQNGQLDALSPESTIPTQLSPSALTIDPTGNYVYATNYESNTVSMYSINQSSGQLTALIPESSVATGTHPVAISVAEVGNMNYVYVTNQGNNKVSQYVESSNGVLMLLDPSTNNTGAVPQGIVSATINNFTYTYVVNRNSNSVSIFNNDNSGQLTSDPSVVSAPTESSPYGITWRVR